MCADTDECAQANVCTADYPCVNLRPFYTCRGQFADWTPSDSPHTFVDNGNSTVTDTRNALVWQKNVPTTFAGCSWMSGAACTWDEAKAYCGNIGSSLPGSGWRLPTYAELESIVDFTRTNPAIDPTTFPNTPVPLYWTASPLAGSSGYAWAIHFDFHQSASAPTSYPYFARCVRSSTPAITALGNGGAPPGRYIVGGDGTALDARTTLTWQREPDSTLLTYQQAADYCNSLAIGRGGWRLPKVSELLTLVDPTRSNPVVDSNTFTIRQPGLFWSASPDTGSSYGTVSLASGFSGSSGSDPLQAICVR
jgi:hypothetical protein